MNTLQQLSNARNQANINIQPLSEQACEGDLILPDADNVHLKIAENPRCNDEGHTASALVQNELKINTIDGVKPGHGDSTKINVTAALVSNDINTTNSLSHGITTSGNGAAPINGNNDNNQNGQALRINGGNSSALSEPSRNGKLHFYTNEKKLNALEKKSNKYGSKLEKARSKQPTKKAKKKELVFDEKKGKAKSKLAFEEVAIPIGEAKWNVPITQTAADKVTKTVTTVGVNKLHSKVYQVERENVGTQAAHKTELVTESAYRGTKRATKSAYRFVRNRPYRQISKLESQNIKNEAKLSFRRALRDNEKLKGKPVLRFLQKKRIQRKYAAAIKNAKNSAKTAKHTFGVMAKVSRLATGLIRRNPVLMLKIMILLLIIISVMTLFTMCLSLFSGGSGLVGELSYIASDEAIEQVELNYTEWETDLKIRINNTENIHSGYDEYHYNISVIGHDPFELMAFLTAVYGDFTYEEVESVLRDIFNEQYNLEFIPQTEVRTRMETRTGSYYDPELDEIIYYNYTVEVEYNWYILNINLTSKPLMQVIYPIMTVEQRQRFSTLMYTKGARQIVGSPFDFDWLPHVTSYYGYRIHPISGEKNLHRGLDIALPTGTEIRAGFDGTVAVIGNDAGYGIFIIIDNGNGLQARYAHCNSVLVVEGQRVTKGLPIATVGSSGNTTGPHLHMEVVKDGKYMNPIFYTEIGDMMVF